MDDSPEGVKADPEQECQLLLAVITPIAALIEHYRAERLTSDSAYRMAHAIQLASIVEILVDLNGMKLHAVDIFARLDAAVQRLRN